MFSNFLKNVVNTVAPEVTAPRPPSHGFRVLRVRESSPGATAGVEAFYDFLVAVDGAQLDGDTRKLRLLLDDARADLSLSLWSVKGGVVRTVRVAPTSLTHRPLGLALRWCPTHPTLENVYHVLDVAPDSPAARAGLVGRQDWIVGTPEGIVRGESGMSELIEDHLGRPLKLYVYNAHHDSTREVVIVANKGWGGQGSMGCGIGFGALHRLPRPLTEPPEGPGETLFDAPSSRPSTETDDAAAAASLPTGAQLSASLPPASTTTTGTLTDGVPAHPPVRAKKRGVARMTAAEIEAMADEASADVRPASRTTAAGASSSSTPPPPPPPAVKATASAVVEEDAAREAPA